MKKTMTEKMMDEVSENLHLSSWYWTEIKSREDFIKFYKSGYPCAFRDKSELTTDGNVADDLNENETDSFAARMYQTYGIEKAALFDLLDKEVLKRV